MADYQLTATNEPCAVIRYRDGATIPPDMANRDYNGDQFSPGYIQWKAAGNTPDPAPPPPPPPLPVPDANARITAGVLASLEVAIAIKTAMQNIPDTFNNQNFIAVKIQLDALTQAFAAMLQAQADVTPNTDPKP